MITKLSILTGSLYGAYALVPPHGLLIFSSIFVVAACLKLHTLWR